MIPSNPITISINGLFVQNELNDLMDTFLPNYSWLKTSGYRNIEQNQKAGGVADSAHLYNLAQDGVLINKATGKMLSDQEMENIFETYIKPNWKGYAEFNYKKPSTNTGWIHLNLDRGLSKYSGWIGAAAAIGGVALLFRKQLKKIRGK